MPKLGDHQSNLYQKFLLAGDAMSGKTGSLVSLVAAGYKLRILDFDNGLEPLKQFVYKQCPDRIDNVEFVTLEDKFKASPAGPVLDGPPTAFVRSIKLLDKWKYDDVDLGAPYTWGPDVILVIDSLTFQSDAAFNWAYSLSPGTKDPRQWYKTAQDAIEKVLATVKGDNFKTNVIVISHVKYIERDDGTKKGYPTSVGSALSPEIPRYFNSVALCETRPGGKRTIQTVATAMIDLKNPKPFEMAKSYDLETGLADFFKVLRAQPGVKNAPVNTPVPQADGDAAKEDAGTPRRSVNISGPARTPLARRA